MQQEQISEWVGLTDAAIRLGLSVDTVRRKVKRGDLTGRQVPRAQGFTWEVYIADAEVQPAPTQQELGGQDLGDLVALVKDLTQQNVQLAGRVGWLESQLQQAQEEVRLLQAPGPIENPMVPAEQHQDALHRPWWQFWMRTAQTT